MTHTHPAGPIPPADPLREAFDRHRAGALAEAVALYRAYLDRHPDSCEGHYLLGLCLAQRHEPEAAEACLATALRLRPDDAVLLRSHGNILKMAGRHQEAVARFDAALALDPASAETHRCRALSLKALGRFDAALAAFGAALAVEPDHVDTLGSRANLLVELGRPDAALADYDRALALRPDFVEAYNNRGVVLNGRGAYREAMLGFCKALTLRKDYPEAYNNRGITFKSLGKYEMALRDYDTALALRPAYPEAHNNRGNALKEMRRLEEALQSFERAIALKPDYAEAYNNRGVVRADLRQTEEAIHNYDRAIALKPDYAEAHFNRALCHLQLGRFAEGWPGYEWRWRNPNLRLSARKLPLPPWRGEADLAGRTLLLHGEQGLGDAIQFCRYARLAAARGARVVLEADPALARLLTGLDGVDQLVVRGEALPAFDLHCPLLSLPLAFGTTLDTIPAAPSYLAADPALVERWRHRLGPAAGPRIGVVWSGNGNHRNDLCRSLPLAAFAGLMSARFDFLCLQKEIRDADAVLASETPGLRLFCDEIADFADTAALCALCDLVISVDTSVAHLAAALGRPTWVALPFNSDWRWQLERSDSPWYPSLRLYRQSVADGLRGDWGAVLAALGADLAARFGGDAAG
ncbi:MAG: hypothetical protein RLZZ501_2569, partial [Pseudomonadota bacterium]